MGVIDVNSGKNLPVRISPVVEADHKKITRKRFHFSWSSLLGIKDYMVFKLQLKEGGGDLLGLLAVQDFTAESRVEIKLLACSAENVGKNKVYDGIAGHLFAYACQMALRKYGRNACVSLVPKTNLREYYIAKYQMHDGGWQLYVEGVQLQNIIREYPL